MNRLTALYLMVGTWLLSKVADWSASKIMDSMATVENLSITLVYLLKALSLISGPFGLGFMIGALLFSAWDLPHVGKWLRNRRSRKRDKVEDAAIAMECENMSRRLFEQASLVERIRGEKHWEGAKSLTDSKTAWIEARQAEAREDERFRNQVGHEIQTLLLKLENRKIKMDLWGYSLSHFDLSNVSYFFAEVALALRDGTYFEKTYSIVRQNIRI
ncbi:hypothetical protein [Pseudomonas silesiensis]